MNHQKTGKQGEDAAVRLLESKNYRIAARNFRAGKAEIDIIAWAPDGTLVFLEVKTRKNERFGPPEISVTRAKQALMFRAAGAYMESIQYEWAVRFDTVAVILRHDKILEIRHIEDTFFPGL